MQKFIMTLMLATTITACKETKHQYGNDPNAAKYVDVNGTKIYYEVYGEGPPLLLIHGDFYGYISEFEEYLPLLTKHFRVIAMARRGHGKSELGKDSLSYELSGEDGIAILKHEHIEKCSVLGFSGGATIALYLINKYPSKFNCALAIAGGIDHYPKQSEIAKADVHAANFAAMRENMVDFFEEREKLMPDPKSYALLHEQFKRIWTQDVYVDSAEIASIDNPIMLIVGDRDQGNSLEATARLHRTLKRSFLAVVPNCDHVGVLHKADFVNATAIPFLIENSK